VIVLSKRSNPINSFDYDVLLIQRSAKVGGFFSKSYVFPGGVIEECDASEQWDSSVKNVTLLSFETLACRIGVLRELFEETGLLLAKKTSENNSTPFSGIHSLHENEREETRKSVHNDAKKFVSLCGQKEIAPEVEKLIPWSRWTTPTFESKRFDTFFYVATIATKPDWISPDHQEVSNVVWMTPTEALSAAKMGNISLPPPTTYLLHELALFPNVQDFLQRKIQRNFSAIMPTLVRNTTDEFFLALPGDSHHHGSKGQSKHSHHHRMLPRYKDQEALQKRSPTYWEIEGLQNFRIGKDGLTSKL